MSWVSAKPRSARKHLYRQTAYASLLLPISLDTPPKKQLHYHVQSPSRPKGLHDPDRSPISESYSRYSTTWRYLGQYKSAYLPTPSTLVRSKAHRGAEA